MLGLSALCLICCRHRCHLVRICGLLLLMSCAFCGLDCRVARYLFLALSSVSKGTEHPEGL